jgi:UDP-glucose 4-epimerase
MSKVALVTGISGGLAQLVAGKLAQRDYEIIGVDYRKVPIVPDCLTECYQANYNKTKIEDVFRRHRPTHVFHLGRVGNLKERMGKRFDLNVMGSRKVMNLTVKYQTSRLVVLSTFHIYGAHPHNHIPIYESEPLRAGTAFPQIADAIQLDNQAVTWIYRHPEVGTTLIRPCNVIGPNIRNAMSNVLRARLVPVMLGFSPMIQFIHERDLARAIVAAAEGEASGVYNVAGRGSVPWRDAVDMAGATQVPIPSSLAATYLRAAGLVTHTFPPYLVNFFKYPCVISSDAINESFGFTPRIGQAAAIRSTVAAARGWTGSVPLDED